MEKKRSVHRCFILLKHKLGTFHHFPHSEHMCILAHILGHALFGVGQSGEAEVASDGNDNQPHERGRTFAFHDNRNIPRVFPRRRLFCLCTEWSKEKKFSSKRKIRPMPSILFRRALYLSSLLVICSMVSTRCIFNLKLVCLHMWLRDT